MSQIPMTVEGAQRLRDELHELKDSKTPGYHTSDSRSA